jgi:hypothetical protein
MYIKERKTGVCVNKNQKIHFYLKHTVSKLLHSATLTYLYVQFLSTVLADIIKSAYMTLHIGTDITVVCPRK